MKRLTALFILLSTILGNNSLIAKDKILFNRDIRPLLSDNCFACHGPDEHERKAKLRLDIKEGGGFEDRDGVVAIIPNDLDNSELIARITSDDEDELMPPKKSGKKLNTDQINLLKEWIKQGAEYEGHWSFNKPAKSIDPTINPIDHFIETRLNAQKLKLSDPAAAHTLIRRISLDLTGIAPTLEEVKTFQTEHNKDPQAAMQNAATRLMDSPRYGERMAIFWLDLVRYADSIGYHSDTNMNVYLYREWVINAFNANQRFDQFTKDQIAGDLLPNSTDEQKIASGYNRLLQTLRREEHNPKNTSPSMQRTGSGTFLELG